MPPKLESYWDLLDPAWDDLSIDNPDAWRASQSRHPRPVVHLYASHFCQSEVCNGGFDQFFRNSTGILGPEAVEAFHALVMPQTAQVLATAVEKLGQPYPRDRAARWDQLLIVCGSSMSKLEASLGPSLLTRKNYHHSPEFSRAFQQTTKPLVLDALNKQFFSLIESENGGFEAAATAYANSSFTALQSSQEKP